ncbi:4-(cytidine 5'-diphospho)-2-C-methyl-D-erythritol kinase [Virgibacillus phasianinus]|uniref:4-diphosphocytidyl-2-C-methyl-D-erythritol kinase n=1 Tax=Virgibacillus phasianinus TaxID=2017483 RepID=A0A220U0F3_9BACI|nr:4-(cytidine 5'-diphospho)-2-C-methyl-D-erythritol kinase [Virgibacillus phasianinus]ASK61714.1 4-(cytidine 5'-diphospho)-2-C-methyl-D-erythritol kinase [Virgibacillus phasianinus]
MVFFENAPAKITLSLDVLGKRVDGYHDVEMVMTTVDLADRVALTSLDSDYIDVSADNQYVPNDERNLAFKAAHALKDKYHITRGVRIDIEKNIPVSAGLGGGSSDAAAVLRGLTKLWELDIPLSELANLGASIGSDVPFCVYGSTALARGRGEIIEELLPPPVSWAILAKPNIGVSTRVIFNRLALDDLSHPNTPKVLDAIRKKDFHKLCNQVGNVLETVTTSLYPNVLRIKEKMIQAGANGVLMSGSGPTIVGLVEHQHKAIRIYNGLRGFCDEVYVVRIIGHASPC